MSGKHFELLWERCYVNTTYRYLLSAGDAFCFLPRIQECCSLGRFQLGECFSTRRLCLKRCRMQGIPLGTADWFSATDEEGRTLPSCKPIALLVTSRSYALLTMGIEFCGAGWGDGFSTSGNNGALFTKSVFNTVSGELEFCQGSVASCSIPFVTCVPIPNWPGWAQVDPLVR